MRPMRKRSRTSITSYAERGEWDRSSWSSGASGAYDPPDESTVISSASSLAPSSRLRTPSENETDDVISMGEPSPAVGRDLNPDFNSDSNSLSDLRLYEPTHYVNLAQTCPVIVLVQALEEFRDLDPKQRWNSAVAQSFRNVTGMSISVWILEWHVSVSRLLIWCSSFTQTSPCS